MKIYYENNYASNGGSYFSFGLGRNPYTGAISLFWKVVNDAGTSYVWGDTRPLWFPEVPNA